MIAIYIRVSSVTQKYDRQTDLIEEYLNSLNIKLNKCKIYKETISAWSEDRKEFEKLARDIKSGSINELIITESDRLYKSLGDMIFFGNILKLHNVTLTNLNQKIEDEFIIDQYKTIFI